MSQKIETAILQALAHQPGRRFSVSELAGIAEASQRQITHLAERRRGWWPFRRSA